MIEVKRKVFVFGDSHAGKFGIDPDRFILWGPHAPTAYGLGSEDSKSGSLLLLRDMLVDVTPEDVILFVLGEIDCRIHIYNQVQETGFSYRYTSELIIHRYGHILNSVKENNTPNVAVLDVPPAVAQGNIYGYEHYASRDERAKIARIFNEELEYWCNYNDICFVNLHKYITDERGWLREEYAVWDGAHVTADTVPFVVDELRKCFPNI